MLNQYLQHVISGLILSVLVSPTGVYAGISIDGSLTQDKVAQPGETYSGVIGIRNTGSEPVEAKVFQTDYAFSADGRNDYGPPGRLPRSNASWLRLGQEQIIVLGTSTAKVRYEMKVPGDAKLKGSYWSLVMVQPVSAKEESRGGPPNKLTAQLSQVIRYAIQMVTDIGKTGQPQLAFGNPQVVKKGGERVFVIDAENPGERWRARRCGSSFTMPSGAP